MEKHHIAGLRSMTVGAVLVILSFFLFSIAAGNTGEAGELLMIFFPLYVIFSAGIFLAVHGLFVHFPRSQVTVHHYISYSILLLILVGAAYFIYQTVRAYY